MQKGRGQFIWDEEYVSSREEWKETEKLSMGNNKCLPQMSSWVQQQETQTYGSD